MVDDNIMFRSDALLWTVEPRNEAVSVYVARCQRLRRLMCFLAAQPLLVHMTLCCLVVGLLGNAVAIQFFGCVWKVDASEQQRYFCHLQLKREDMGNLTEPASEDWLLLKIHISSGHTDF